MTAKTKTLIRSCLLACAAAAFAAPAQAQFSTTQSHVIGLGLAHNEQGNTVPSTTSTMPGAPPAVTALLDKPAAAIEKAITPLPFPPPYTLRMPPSAVDLRTTPPHPGTLSTSAAATHAPPAVPSPGPATLLAVTAAFGLRRRPR